MTPPLTRDGVEYKNGMKIYSWSGGRPFKNYKELEAVWDDAFIGYSNQKVGWLIRRVGTQFGSIGVNCVFSSKEAYYKFRMNECLEKVEQWQNKADRYKQRIINTRND